jgi:hypothetical protein
LRHVNQDNGDANATNGLEFRQSLVNALELNAFFGTLLNSDTSDAVMDRIIWFVPVSIARE